MGKRAFVHLEIPSADGAVMRRFYGDLFGWEFSFSEAPEYWSFMNDSLNGGLAPLGGDVKPGDMMLYLDSEDIEADLKRIEAAGGKTLVPKMEIPTVGWFAVFSDPTGNRLSLFTPLPMG